MAGFLFDGFQMPNVNSDDSVGIAQMAEFLFAGSIKWALTWRKTEKLSSREGRERERDKERK